MNNTHRVLLSQFLRYVMSGGLAFVVDFATLYALTEFAGLHYLLSATIGFLAGLVVNYLLCIWWIFEHRSQADQRKEFTVFALIGVAGLALNNGLLFTLTDLAGINYLLSKMVAAAFILFFNFLLRRHILFSQRG